MAIELIAMASLVTNREAVENAEIVLASRKTADEAVKAVKQANPDHYWPEAIRIVREPGKMDVFMPKDGALTEQKWQAEWGRLSAILHARNPLRDQTTFDEAKALVARLLDEVMALVNVHTFQLANRKVMLLGQIDDNGVSVTDFDPTPEGTPPPGPEDLADG